MALLYLLLLVTVFVITFLITRVCRRLRQRHYEVPARDVSKGHRWCMTDIFPQPTYCSISEDHILHGAFCDSCGICVEDRNVRAANRVLPCKALANTSQELTHHWVLGNLPLCSKCSVCDEDCGNLPQLCDYRCCWCDRTIHTHCRDKTDSDRCDLGKYQRYIVPPNCVRLKLVGIKGRRHLIVESVKEPVIEDWHPLIVMANRKSGNGDGEAVLQAFRGILNPAQVYDVTG